MHILFADDSRASALPVIEFLRQRGNQVTYVEDGRAALTAYQAVTPDLVLLDVVMPELDGIEVTRCIRQLCGGRWLPVILMTACSGRDEIVAGLDAGADDYLIKPIGFEVLDARVRSMQRIATMQDSLFGILDNVYEGLVTTDEQGRIQSFNKAAERIFGYGAAEVVGGQVNRLMPEPQASRPDGFLARYLGGIRAGAVGVDRKIHGRRKDGTVFPMRLSVTEVKGNGRHLYIGLVRDLSEEERARARIVFLALHDPLTGLANRAHFHDVLDALIAEDDGGCHAILFIDLDGFKQINDHLGHDAGDEALRVVARRLRHDLAHDDFVARLGGDEFVVIARNIADSGIALVLAERLRLALSGPLLLHGRECELGASIGVALIPDHGDTADTALTAADNAMYAAKRAGKARVALASVG